MNEPQSLDQAMDSAMGQSESTVTEEVGSPQVETQESTPTAEETTQEESYTRIDPKTLAPELQPVHKSLLRDYTKKTQYLAQQRKELEQQRKEIEALQQKFSQPQVQEQGTQEDTGEIQPHAGMSLQEYEAYLMAKVEQNLTRKQQEAIQQQENSYLERAVQEFESLDERLNSESPGYDQYMHAAIGTQLDKALDAYAKEHGSAIGFEYSKVAADLIEQYDNYIESRASERAAVKTKAAFEGVKRTAPLGVKGSQVPATPAGRMSLDEALDNAFAGAN